MKVILVNGSPHLKGTTYRALQEVQKSLEENGVETRIYQLGAKPISGCIGCGVCYKTGKCFMDDKVNEFVELAKEADGFIFSTSVHYAAATGSITSFLDRVFYSGGIHLAYKPAASVITARRAGTSATFDQMNKYITINNMPLVSSNYWNAVHGLDAEDAQKDIEGMQTMRILGDNMAWMLKCIELGKQNGINPPEIQKRTATNFIR